ncbi:MAG: ribosomal protein S18-alanine N-acetyltransferase [Pyrinomonadaceae bacterium]
MGLGTYRMSVQRMSEHDLLEIVEIEETCALSPWGWENYHAELARADAITLVAETDSKQTNDAPRLAGFIVARIVVDELQINNVAVCIEARRRSVGSELLRAAMAEAKRRGAQSAMLEVRASNTAAQRLYAKYDFILCGRRKNYYREPAEDALLLCAGL